MMKALGSSYLNLFSCKQRVILCSREIAPSKQEIGFLGYQKRVIDNYERVISSQHKYIHSISAASSVQKIVENDELQTFSSDSTKTVHIQFKLHKECAFGEQFIIVGDDPILGSWEPSNAVPLNWSDGHIWTADLDIPIGKVIKYKFILKGVTGTVLWQPGPDRILETRDSEKTITVFEDWDNPQLQNIVEDDILSNNECLIESDSLIIDENLNEIIMDEEVNVINGGCIDHVEKINPPMVAENIVLESEGQDLSSNDEGSCLICANDEKNDEISNFSSSKDETKLVLDEGVPVLVPGLIPMLSEEINEGEGINDAKSGLITTSFEEINEADGIIDAKPGLITTAFEEVNEAGEINDPELLNEMEKIEVESISIEADEVKELTMAELKDEHVNEMMTIIDENQQIHEKEKGMKIDMQWGRQTLQRFLDIFGFQ